MAVYYLLLICCFSIIEPKSRFFLNDFNTIVVTYFFKILKNNYIVLYGISLSVALLGSFVPLSHGQQAKGEFKQYFFKNGNVSSEGYLLDGKPNGLWKAYHENGNLKSVGKRRNFELDSIWSFYDDRGLLTEMIPFQNGLKSGLAHYYNEDGFLQKTSNFVAGRKEGTQIEYYENGSIQKETPFQENKENGIGFEFDEEGKAVTLNKYNKGWLVRSEKINRKNKQGNKQGLWKYFYPGGDIKEEQNWSDGKKHGYFKKYDRDKNLIEVKRYEFGKEVSDTDMYILELRKEFYPDGSLKLAGTYHEDIRQGTFREYSKSGEQIGGFIYEKGVKIASGIVDENGFYQGGWKYFYPTGELKSEGKYLNSLRKGIWKFYFRDGTLEQEGEYSSDLPDGRWRWYYSNGNLHREENYSRGLEDGLSVEYTIDKSEITRGEFVEGLKEGKWIYQMGDHKEVGFFRDGRREGDWLYYYKDGSVHFKGEFQDGEPNGLHTYLFPSGKVKLKANYEMGVKHGEWIRYNSIGDVVYSVVYENGIERKIDGVKIKQHSKDLNAEIE